MMEDAGDRRYRRDPALTNSREPPAQSFRHQLQHPHRTYGQFLDPTNIGNPHHNINPSSAQLEYVTQLHSNAARVPPYSYEEPFPPHPNIGGSPAILFNDGFFPKHLEVAAPLYHSGGPSNIGLEDAPSLTTAYTGRTTTANTTSEAGRTSHTRHGFVSPSHTIQSSTQPVASGSGQSIYPLGQVDNYNVPNHGPSAVDTNPAPAPWDSAPTIPRLNGHGQRAQFEPHVNAQVSFASAGNTGTDAHSNHTRIHHPRRELVNCIDPRVLTATNGPVSSEIAYSDGAVDTMDDLPFFPPPFALNINSHANKFMFENSEDKDHLLCGVGGVFDCPRNLSFQTAHQTTSDDSHGQTNYTATGPLPGQQHWSLDFSTGYQDEGTPNFTRFVQQPDSSIHHTMASSVDTTAETNPATSFFATGAVRARAEPGRVRQSVPMETQRSILRNPRASQVGPTHRPTMSGLPSSPLPTRSNRNDTVAKERGRRKERFSPEKKYKVKKRKVGKTVCIVCRYNRVECDKIFGQSCSKCVERKLLCATAYFSDLYRGVSILPVFNQEGVDEKTEAVVSNDVDIAALRRRIDGLDPQFNIRATSADGKLNVVLDMENLHKPLCQGPSSSRSYSDMASTSNGRIANPFKWTTCIKASKASANIEVLAKQYLVCPPVTFEYVSKADSRSVRGVQDHEHNGALNEVVDLLRRNLELEAWEVFHGRIYIHKDMGKKKTKRKGSKTRKARKPRARKASPHRLHPPSVRSLAWELLTMLRALREYFQPLARGAIKFRVGELCKRLYCYFLFLQGNRPNRLGNDDLQRLCQDLDFGRNELPADEEKRPTRAFFNWIGASDEDVLWWGEECMRENIARTP